MRPPSSQRAAPRSLTLEVRLDDAVEYWQPATPSDGWAPAAAFDRACSFAARSAGHERRRTGAAYQALLGAVPGLKRVEVRERLAGVDHFRDHFEPCDALDDRPAVLDEFPF
ncbi:hypothetical protein GRS96_12210 [Rathayibacter sp. VKM Ac-2803]|uniref:hypothetical protein n=1 Tax=Rathayibacter sp. VKM Ac-2803 TaxID=2609256 RepID=UPI0013570704|nr:hypothetical protein [Rathayibacter sp. VKM Ac-2803]MWV50033.1 hypothetical protein [Rathayibacter sp. VKM Ac-2803]